MFTKDFVTQSVLAAWEKRIKLRNHRKHPIFRSHFPLLGRIHFLSPHFCPHVAVSEDMKELVTDAGAGMEGWQEVPLNSLGESGTSLSRGQGEESFWSEFVVSSLVLR